MVLFVLSQSFGSSNILPLPSALNNNNSAVGNIEQQQPPKTVITPTSTIIYKETKENEI